MTEPQSDADSLSVHLLDMGVEKYGDCIVCQHRGATLLIDGGHRGDYRRRYPNHPSIPEQLQAIFGHPAPFEVDLLVVTHVHSDHIGCLPDLVSNSQLLASWALVADEALGFGRFEGDGLDALWNADAPPAVRRVLAALREESRADLSDQELAQFLADAETLEQRYKEMLSTLSKRGTRIVRYGRDDISELLEQFRGINLRILGPTQEHLEICARDIAERTQDAVELLGDYFIEDAVRDELAVYRSLAELPVSDAIDRPGKGASINNQSIVLTLGRGQRKILLTGDMQLAEPEVGGLNEPMMQLRERIAEHAPFAFAKLPHHTSYNGLDEKVLEDLKETPLLGHSGGTRDRSHPDPGVLRLLKRRRDRFAWVRTDRNGMISVTFGAGDPKIEVTGSTGLSITTPNFVDTTMTPEAPAPAPGIPPALAAPPPPPPAAPAVHIQPVPGQDTVEVMAKIPYRRTRVVLTVDIQPQDEQPALGGLGPVPAPSRPQDLPGKGSQIGELADLAVAPGRRLPSLLFVTSGEALADNLGRAEAQHVLQALRKAGQDVFDELPRGLTEATEVAARILGRVQAKEYAGVVILGGHDVVPMARLDTLPTDLRPRVRTFDADDYIVWSDDIYGCIDGDSDPELPVSRIPDARSYDLVVAALQAGQPARQERFGIRNTFRPYAADVFSLMPGQQEILISEPTQANGLTRDNLRADTIYLMLHGQDRDGTTFWGENREGIIEAITVQNIPTQCPSVVFTGCCWGALTVEKRACRVERGEPVAAKNTEASIALTFLRAGAQAFIGCTGVHYSPGPPYDYAGAEMHRAFWRAHVERKLPPARALFEAKLEFLADYPHGQNTPEGQAAELKTLRQFTCLGLGW